MHDITHHYANIGEVKLHYVRAGQGTPVLLLHGFLQTWYEWRDVIPAIAKHHTVIAPDMRGLGDSSKPAIGYDARTVAEDIWGLINRELGFEQFHVVGHDWGGPVAYALTAAHRQAVTRLAILDVTIPGDGRGTALGGFSQGGRRWWHPFFLEVDLAEEMLRGKERYFFTWIYRGFSHSPVWVTEEVIDEYMRTYLRPGSIRAGLSYYRELERDARYNQESAREKLLMPVLALGGAGGRGRGGEVVESLQSLAVDVRGGSVEQCGHFIPEEKPAFLARELLGFFA